MLQSQISPSRVRLHFALQVTRGCQQPSWQHLVLSGAQAYPPSPATSQMTALTVIKAGQPTVSLKSGLLFGVYKKDCPDWSLHTRTNLISAVLTNHFCATELYVNIVAGFPVWEKTALRVSLKHISIFFLCVCVCVFVKYPFVQLKWVNNHSELYLLSALQPWTVLNTEHLKWTTVVLIHFFLSLNMQSNKLGLQNWW